MVPHIRTRPITMERYPAGIDKKGFIQKDVSKGFPAWLERVEVPKKDGTVHHAIVTDTRSLLWIANQNTLTPHVWSSRAPDLYHPDICVFDLDPSEDDPDALRAAALGLRDLLKELGLPSWVKTSGSKGFHIVVPLDRKADMGEVSGFAHHRRQGAGQPRSAAPHAGVQQGRPRQADSRRHRAERLQRDVGRALRRASEAWRTSVRAVHVGGSRKRRGRAADVHAAARWPRAWAMSATCGRICASAGGRCGGRSRSCVRCRKRDRGRPRLSVDVIAGSQCLFTAPAAGRAGMAPVQARSCAALRPPSVRRPRCPWR